ncbi:MAG: hypothetical protein PUJ02_01060 [Anaerovibrio sp.]|uniref:hypothetical protein n=1 Tax=Anaerovibrio sp. TaxID=1872532 RepID=UPI00262D05AA|nr:hypothetical protein [Anaerovibrio sp.]MDD7677061.1 hypothetical protein [Anaerovibrio sp.]
MENENNTEITAEAVKAAEDELAYAAKEIIKVCKENNILKEYFDERGEEAENIILNMLLSDELEDD